MNTIIKVIEFLLSNRYTITVSKHNEIIDSMNKDIVILINAIDLLKQSVEIKDNLNKKYKEKIDRLELELYQVKEKNKHLDFIRSN